MTAKIVKKHSALIDDSYVNPNTSTITFQFEPEFFQESASRLRGSAIQHGEIAGKDIYVIDHFFQSAEREEMTSYSQSATFSRSSYGSPKAIEEGQKPASSMNNKERWQFFANPPKAIHEFYKLLSTLSHALDVEITTLPWELCCQSSIGSPAVIANKLSVASKESRELGKHQDYNPEDKISFGIPILYSNTLKHHPGTFINGTIGNPLLLSAMIYITSNNFRPECGLGTVFYDNEENVVFRTNCLNMRLVLFQGDIFHSMEESMIPGEETVWRVSYVFKLIFNPRSAKQSIREQLMNLLKSNGLIQSIPFGPNARG